MNGLGLALRKARAQLAYLRSYLDLNVAGNRIERRTDFSRCERPVLLLYGFFSTRRTLEVLERRLRRDGYCVFSLNLGGLRRAFNTRGIDDLADFVRAKVERLYTRFPAMGPLTIVGHSKGGLIATYYVKRLGGHRRARTVITLGTPHNGTPAAYFGAPIMLLAHSLVQMTPVSPFIHRLQRAAWPDNVRVTSVYSRQDLMTPYPSGLLDTKGLPQIRNIEVECTHREFLYKKQVYDVVLREIRAAEAAVPRLKILSDAG